MGNVAASGSVGAKGTTAAAAVSSTQEVESAVYNRSAEINTFIAAKRADLKAYKKYIKIARAEYGKFAERMGKNDKTLQKIMDAVKANEPLLVYSDSLFWSYDSIVEMEVKSRLLFGSKELEWMMRDRTPEEELLVKKGIELLDKGGGTILLIPIKLELMAKNQPAEAIDMAEKFINGIKDSSAGYELDFKARVQLDLAFILIKTKKDPERAEKIYREVSSQRAKYDPYIIEMLDVLGNYIPSASESKNNSYPIK